IRRDTRDSIFNTTKGYVLNGNFDIAGGALGGDKDFYRWQGRGDYYIPLKYDSVLEFRGHMGIVNDYGDSRKVPIFERFFAGGAKTIRGYNERKVGPLDNSTEDPIGGESIFVANIEYKVPVLDFIKLAAFFDTGNVWPDVGDMFSG
ncbi:Bacterial surface antigen (D15) domain protein, partial [Candidatus Magnetomorum sp. HK-1]